MSHMPEKTLADHAEEWARDRGEEIFARDSVEWSKMYQRWIEFAFRHSAASTLGRLGGLVKSEAKSTSSRANGRKGGRPKSTKSIDMEDI